MEHVKKRASSKRWTRAKAIVTALSSSILVGLFFHYVYQLFQKYDWGQSFTKFLCFSACAGVIYALSKGRVTRYRRITQGKLLVGLELFLAIVALLWLLTTMLPQYLGQIEHGPRVDIGYTTQNSAIVLFKERKNPYQSETINVRPELKPEHRGFHYGPGMLLGYVASAEWPNIGYKISNLAYLIFTLLALIVLIDGARERSDSIWQRVVSGLVVSVFFLLPERLWYEVFMQGANDIFPVALIMMGLVCVQRRWMFAAGVFLGFSFTTKFSPAAFLLVLFLRRDIELRFLIGCVIGSIPLFVFSVWDFQSLFSNVFYLRFALNYDSTSLYSITPQSLHYLFPLIQLATVVVLLFRNFKRSLTVDVLILHFVVLLVVVEVTFKEIHANHLIWFYPIFAFIAARYRYLVWHVLSRVFLGGEGRTRFAT